MAVGACDNKVFPLVNSASSDQRVMHSKAETYKLLIQKEVGHSEALCYFCLPHRYFWLLSGIPNDMEHLYLANELYLCAVICISEKLTKKKSKK